MSVQHDYRLRCLELAQQIEGAGTAANMSSMAPRDPMPSTERVIARAKAYMHFLWDGNAKAPRSKPHKKP